MDKYHTQYRLVKILAMPVIAVCLTLPFALSDRSYLDIDKELRCRCLTCGGYFSFEHDGMTDLFRSPKIYSTAVLDGVIKTDYSPNTNKRQ